MQPHAARHKPPPTPCGVPPPTHNKKLVPVKLIASFKRIKALTREQAAVAAALRASPELVVDDEGRRVRRAVPLGDVDTGAIARRIVVAEHLGEGPTIGA